MLYCVFISSLIVSVYVPVELALPGEPESVDVLPKLFILKRRGGVNCVVLFHPLRFFNISMIDGEDSTPRPELQTIRNLPQKHIIIKVHKYLPTTGLLTFQEGRYIQIDGR